MNSEIGRLVARYATAGVLIDAQLLLVYFVGRFDRARIVGFKRTAAYTAEDYDRLILFLRPFQKVVTTPNVLTEVSNFLDSRWPLEFYQGLARDVALLEEHHIPSADLVRSAHFAKLGLSDLAIVQLVKGRFLTITADLPLYHYMVTTGVDAVNFWHLST